jgi:multidrug efflux pump subunit AcrB
MISKDYNSGNFFKFTTTRPVAILMVVLGVLVFGWISYKQLPLNLMPDISYPSLTIRTEYPGTAPEEVETTISRPIEQEVGVVDNLVTMTSISKADQSDIILEYNWDTDMNQATAELREKLDQVYLPEEVKRPLILRYDPSLDPIIRLGLYGDRSLFYLRYLADEDIKRRLETIEGVAAVKVKGGLEEEIRVELNEQQLTLIGINIQQIRDRLAQENINLAGGNLREGQTEYIVRTLNEFKTVDEVTEVVIGNWNGRNIKIKDVGKVKRTNKEREIITRMNGKESTEIEIYKEADANIVAVAKRVTDTVLGTPEQRAFVKKLEAEKKEAGEKDKQSKGTGEDDYQTKRLTDFIAYNLPDGVKIDKLSDQSIFIENAVNEVKNTAIIGGILAIIILFIFLRNFIVTLIIGISIPISVIATFAPMKIFGVSLNIMSLGGLALGIGMLVDNSIVVLESISRCREEGDNLIKSTIRGVSEVGSAVFASTLTTIAVFFPIVFVEGVAGQVFGDMSLTVVFSLLASLAVALFLIPMLVSRESEKFISGINIHDFIRHNFLAFTTESKVQALLEVEASAYKPVMEKVITGFSILIKTNLEMLLKMLKSIFAFVLVLLKFISLYLFIFIPVIMPFFALLRKLGIVRFKISEIIRLYAQNPTPWNIEFFKTLWPSYLVNNSLPIFYSDLIKISALFRMKKWFIKLYLFLLAPFLFFFYFFKYLVYIFSELLFRLMHFLILNIALVIKTLYLNIKIILHAPLKWIILSFNWGYSKLEHVYPQVLAWSIHRRMSVIGAMLLIFLFSVFVLGPNIGSELIPEVHQGEFNLEITLAVGTPAEETDRRILSIQEFISKQDGVEKVACVVGRDKTEIRDTNQGEHTATLTVTLKRASSVLIAEERLIKNIRAHILTYSGMKAKISRPTLFSFKTPVEVEIHGYNLRQLQSIAEEIEERMRQLPGLFDVKANIQRGNPEVQIVYNRDLLSHHGLNIFNVASIVRNKVRGDIATEFKEEDRKIDVRVRLREEDKKSIDNLKRLIVNPDSPIPIPLEAVAKIIVDEGPSEIRRIDQQRSAIITANISGRDLGSVSKDIYQVLQSIDMPEDFSFDLAGQNREMQTSLNSLMFALALAIFLVYIVMASQFESLLHPFIIIFTIPMALIGVIFFLYLLNIPASIVVFLGLIMLAGIVVNNAIVLVDYINQLRARGFNKMDAIMTAGKVRLRPILMTTSTTVLGLLPMAVGMGDGAEIRAPMAITVIVGLITSTILTLVVIPTVYYVLDRKA